MRIILSLALIISSSLANAETYICSISHFGETEITKFTRTSNKSFITQTTFTDGKIGEPDEYQISSENNRVLHITTLNHKSSSVGSLIYVIDKKTRKALFWWADPSLEHNRPATRANCVVN